VAAGRAVAQVGVQNAVDGIRDWFDQVGASVVVKLFRNDVTFGPLTTLAALDECVFPGYAPVDINPVAFPDADWVAPVATTTGYQVATFTNTAVAATTVYGYYVVDNNDGYLHYGESFESPVVLGENQEIAILLRLKGRSREY